jgi:hypothetical protein
MAKECVSMREMVLPPGNANRDWNEGGTLSVEDFSHYLPWSTREVSFAQGQYGIKAISTTCMVWNWKQYHWDYQVWDPNMNQGQGGWRYYFYETQKWSSQYTSASIFTRYYDGSP